MTPPDIREMHAVAVEAARCAGEELARLFYEPRSTRQKGLRDIVTDADMAAERAVIETIRRRYPDHAILSEESGALAGDASYQWIIDPLDGTTNYARGLPFFCVAVAVAQAGRPLAGAVYDPLRDAMYHASRGGGAFCNARRLAVSRREGLLDLLIGYDWPRAEAPRAGVGRMAATLFAGVGSLRSMGAAALELCLVAEGALDAYFHLTLHPWDFAASGLIIQEAGGQISSIEGDPDWLAGMTCLGSNGLIHADLLARLGAAYAAPSVCIP